MQTTMQSKHSTVPHCRPDTWRDLLLRDFKQGKAGTAAHARRLSRMFKFLVALRATLNVEKSERIAGLPQAHAYQWRKRYPAFTAIWADIIEEQAFNLEAVAMGRAIDGTVRRTYDREGNVRSEHVEYDTRLTLGLLAAQIPRYNQRVVKHEHSGGVKISFEVGLQRDAQAPIIDVEEVQREQLPPLVDRKVESATC